MPHKLAAGPEAMVIRSRQVCMDRVRAGLTLLSDSVGSTMRVPGTGQDMVGAWKP